MSMFVLNMPVGILGESFEGLGKLLRLIECGSASSYQGMNQMMRFALNPFRRETEAHFFLTFPLA
ncbi:MAG TPA: hypothetical protein VN153_04980 [Tahibacter sp.]|nr:hypothetical protein [Tahibacter sp.]